MVVGQLPGGLAYSHRDSDAGRMPATRRYADLGPYWRFRTVFDTLAWRKAEAGEFSRLRIRSLEPFLVVFPPLAPFDLRIRACRGQRQGRPERIDSVPAGQSYQ